MPGEGPAAAVRGGALLAAPRCTEEGESEVEGLVDRLLQPGAEMHQVADVGRFVASSCFEVRSQECGGHPEAGVDFGTPRRVAVVRDGQGLPHSLDDGMSEPRW